MAKQEAPLEQPTPAPEPVKDKSGVHDGPLRDVVAEPYPDRPYRDAVTPEHLEALKAAGQEPR